MYKILEGLGENDLEDLILPLISIDEYNSKLAEDDEVIVVGFFADDSDPAKDLSNFILKTPLDIIDTDVSPAPNDEGYYMVFVEFPRNKNFTEKLLQLVENIETLTGNTKWQFIAYGSDKLYDLNEENIMKKIDTTKKKEIKTESIAQWFSNSYLDDFLVEGDSIKLNNDYYTYEDFGSYDTVIASLGLSGKPVKIKEGYDTRMLASGLGSNYFVSQIDKYILINSLADGRTLALSS